jgi:hypothetical protein
MIMIEIQTLETEGVGIEEALKIALKRAQQAGVAVMLHTEINSMKVLPSMTNKDLEGLYQEFRRILYEEI